MSTFKKIKDWYKLTKPHKGYMAGLFLTSLASCGISIVQAIPNANVITSLTNMDYDGAVLWLLISLACTLIYYLSWHLNYKFFYLQNKHGVVQLSTQLFNKISSATDEGLSQNSVEKIMMVFTSNIASVVKFTDYISYEGCYLIRSFVTIFIVMYYNWTMGLIMLAVVVLLYFWYVFLGKKVLKHTTNVFAQRDHLGEQLTDIVDGRAPTEKLNLKDTNKEQYLAQVKKIVKSYKSRGTVNTVRKYWTYAVLYIIVTALTIWLAVLTDANKLTLTLYLIIAPYLINIIDQAKAGYEVLYELERTEVARMRIQTVLNMPNRDIVTYSNNTTDNLTKNLVLSNISYIDTQVGAYRSGNLSIINMEIERNTITLIKGIKNCGKRSLFHMLRRTITPATGTITMDGINIYDFDRKTYKHNFSYVTSKPYFYSESILENLQYVNPSKNKIFKVCKQLEIHQSILNLPNGYDTNIFKEHEHFSPYLLFMIGLARAILRKAEWLCVYEFPISLTKKQQDKIKSLLCDLKAQHSIIIFSASETVQDICDNYYTIAAGHVRKLNKVEG